MASERKIKTAIDNWLNKLEPDYLLANFFKFPPVGFRAHLKSNGLPVFSAKFDLTTTMDSEDRKRLRSLPFYRFWSRLLSFQTLFVGTTVSEFSPLPDPLDGKKTAQSLKKDTEKNYSLVIVKDLPHASPLLTTEEVEKTQAFLKALEREGFITVAGQALAYVPVDYVSVDDYLSRFSKNRRKDFRRKMRAMENLNIEVLESGTSLFDDNSVLDHFYKLYCKVFEQSEIHFDFLTADFFKNLLVSNDKSFRIMVYRDKQNTIIGYNICFVVDDMLIDKYIGLDYPAATDNNLYYISWFYNLEYARLNGLKYYVAGWTDPEIKAYLGAKFVYTQHAVFIKNPFLRWILKRFQHKFESDAHLQLQESGYK